MREIPQWYLKKLLLLICIWRFPPRLCTDIINAESPMTFVIFIKLYPGYERFHRSFGLIKAAEVQKTQLFLDISISNIVSLWGAGVLLWQHFIIMSNTWLPLILSDNTDSLSRAIVYLRCFSYLGTCVI